MIDLHLHTTASDGRSSPEALVDEALAAGLSVIAVTDHDTMAAVDAVTTAATTRGLHVVPGIEITAVHHGRDVHVLAYFLDPHDPVIAAFLERQRADRRRRMVDIVAALDRLGASIDRREIDARLADTTGRAAGRPMIAAALVEAGHAKSVADAFDRFLAEGQPAFVERSGPAPEEVFALVERAGGCASLAHPGKLKLDDEIEGWVRAGLPAIEVFHPDHSPADMERYSRMAARLELLVTGGSDYHGPETRRAPSFGVVNLPGEDYERLRARAGRARPHPSAGRARPHQ